jgi:superfamily II DNA or RNA helicase
MEITIRTPTKAFLTAYTEEEFQKLTKQLSYTNTAAAHQVKRHYNNQWARRKNPDAWAKTLDELKSQVHNCLIWEENGERFIRPGSICYLEKLDLKVTNTIKYPTPKKVAWAKPLPFVLYPYQEISWVELISNFHSNVELCTGSGKSAIILKYCRETGYKTVIVAPGKSVFYELIEKFEYHFGRGMVGKFGDQKRDLGKRFTIAIGDSLANLKPGTAEWEFFSTMEAMCIDEAHTWGAETLDEVCHGVLGNVPCRTYYSATMTRGDGAEKLLKSIVARTVCVLTTKEAKEKGYICDHDYRIVEVESSDPNYATADPLDMKRVHHLNNRNIRNFVARLANADAKVNKRQTLVLVDELSQIAALIPLLTVPYVVAHSEKKKERLATLGLEKVDYAESVEKFNKGEAMVLIGTTCISTGTNIFPVHNCFNWQGGCSEIRTKQGSIGRAVRIGSHNPWADRCAVKTKSTIWDFRVVDVYIMDRQTDDRIEFYRESGSEIRTIKLKR